MTVVISLVFCSKMTLLCLKFFSNCFSGRNSIDLDILLVYKSRLSDLISPRLALQMQNFSDQFKHQFKF